MTIYIAPIVQATDSFGQWLGKTNQLINAVSNSVVTVNSNTSVGNAAITGTFTAQSYVTANAGSLFIGTGTANAVVNATAIILQATPTSNVIISPSGMLIDSTTAFTKTLISLSNTVITTSNVSSNAASFTDRLIVGNTYIYNNSVVINTANILSAAVGSNLYVGGQDGNTFINKDGIYIVYNDNLPAGDTNSYLTAYELKVGKVSTSNLNLIGTNSKFFSNVEFYGSNNYFSQGIFVESNSRTGNLVIYSPYDITPDNNWTSQLKIVGNGYNGGLSLDSSGMWVGHNSTTRNLILSTNELARVFIDGTTGYVGINHIAPPEVLTVNGNIRIEATANTGYTKLITKSTSSNTITITLPQIQGTAGQAVITSDNSGTLSFADLPGSSLSIDVTARSIGAGVAASGTAGQIRATDNIIAYFTSDVTYKENVTPIENALDKVNSINGVEFDWTDAYIQSNGGEDSYFIRKHDVGVIAQEIQPILPEAVATRNNGTLAVRYEKIVPLLIEAIKELKAEIDSLKNGN